MKTKRSCAVKSPWCLVPKDTVGAGGRCGSCFVCAKPVCASVNCSCQMRWKTVNKKRICHPCREAHGLPPHPLKARILCA